MPLTYDFKETILATIRSRPGFRNEMLVGAVEELLAGDLPVAKSVLRDVINGTLGFEALGQRVGLPAKSLMRMFGPNGNPQAKNLFAVLAALQEDAGITLSVSAVAKRRRVAKRMVRYRTGAAEKSANLGFAERRPKRWRGKRK